MSWTSVDTPRAGRGHEGPRIENRIATAAALSLDSSCSVQGIEVKMTDAELRHVNCDARALWARIDAHLQGTSPPLSWADIGRKTKIADRTFKRWQQGKNHPLRKSVEDVATALGVSYPALVGGLPPAPPDDPPPSSSGDPFSPTRPADPDTFVGRTALLDALRNALEKGHGVNLVGDVGIGKTSLLRMWAAQASALRRQVVSLSSREVALTPRAFVEAITNQADVPEDADGAADALRQWAERRGRLGAPLVLVDAFDAFALKIDGRFFERLRQMLETAQLMVVLASEVHVGKLTSPGGTSPLAPVLQTLHVGLLDDEEAALLVSRASDLLDPGAPALIREQCGGHPLFIKLLVRQLAARREGDTDEDAVEGFYHEASHLLHRSWKRLDDPHQQALIDAVYRRPIEKKYHNALDRRGLLTRAGQPFGAVLTRFIQEMSCEPTP